MEHVQPVAGDARPVEGAPRGGPPGDAPSGIASGARIGPLEIVGDGAMAGLYGASAVAMWFLVVDAVVREPLATPSLVGGVLLRGLAPAAALSVDLFSVALFTIVHCALFVLFGIAYAWVLARLEHTPDFPLIGISVFVPLELGFVAATRLLVPDVAATLGHGYIVVGNAFAALAMAWYLRVGQHHLDDDA